MLPFLSTLSPNAAVLILTAGLALIALELNRPGSILPGALGLLLSLLAAANIARHHPRPAPDLLFIASIGLLLLQARRSLVWIVPACTTILLIVSLDMLFQPAVQAGISPWTALLCGLFLGAGITLLTRIARRARQNKGLD